MGSHRQRLYQDGSLEIDGRWDAHEIPGGHHHRRGEASRLAGSNKGVLWAKTIISLEAKRAVKARDQRNNDDRIAFAYLLHPRPDGADRSADLMAQHHGVALAARAAKPLHIGAAYPTGRYGHLHFAWSRSPPRHVPHPKLPSRNEFRRVLHDSSRRDVQRGSRA